jgi:hypothetical protein
MNPFDESAVFLADDTLKCGLTSFDNERVNAGGSD